jgi:hypothetical protein
VNVEPRKRGELIRWYFAIRCHKKPRPTDAMPGTEEKIRVLALRVERGERLFHDDDCKDWDDRRFVNGRLFL